MSRQPVSSEDKLISFLLNDFRWKFSHPNLWKSVVISNLQTFEQFLNHEQALTLPLDQYKQVEFLPRDLKIVA